MTSDRDGKPPRVVFVFSGQGSQWLGMGRDLLATEPVFAESMRECDELVRAESGWSLVDRLLGDEPMTVEYEIQPALWAIQVSLARLWRHWGIEPDLVLGHSMGEVAAATTAGALTPRDGAAVICRRSKLVGTLREPGSMVAVALGECEANEAIGELADQVCVAVVNSDHATVLAGDPGAVAAVVAPLQERGVYCRPIRANYASHSPNVEPLRDTMVPALADLDPRRSELPMYSTALNQLVSGDELDAEYWMTNLRQPVRFASAVRAALADGLPTLFIEVSPHPLLVPAIEDEIDACTATASVAVPTLLRDVPENEAMRTALGAAYERGCAPDWTRVYSTARSVPLPTYPWQRQRFWVPATEPAASPVVVVQTSIEPEPEELVVPTQAAAPPEAIAPVVIETPRELAEQIGHCTAEMLAAAPGSVDLSAPLRYAGMDSVLATRLRARLKKELDLHVAVEELLADRPLTELAEALFRRSAPQDRHQRPMVLAR